MLLKIKLDILDRHVFFGDTHMPIESRPFHFRNITICCLDEYVVHRHNVCEQNNHCHFKDFPLVPEINCLHEV